MSRFAIVTLFAFLTQPHGFAQSSSLPLGDEPWLIALSPTPGEMGSATWPDDSASADPLWAAPGSYPEYGPSYDPFWRPYASYPWAWPLLFAVYPCWSPSYVYCAPRTGFAYGHGSGTVVVHVGGSPSVCYDRPWPTRYDVGCDSGWRRPSVWTLRSGRADCDRAYGGYVDYGRYGTRASRSALAGWGGYREYGPPLTWSPGRGQSPVFRTQHATHNRGTVRAPSWPSGRTTRGAVVIPIPGVNQGPRAGAGARAVSPPANTIRRSGALPGRFHAPASLGLGRGTARHPAAATIPQRPGSGRGSLAPPSRTPRAAGARLGGVRPPIQSPRSGSRTAIGGSPTRPPRGR